MIEIIARELSSGDRVDLPKIGHQVLVKEPQYEVLGVIRLFVRCPDTKAYKVVDVRWDFPIKVIA